MPESHERKNLIRTIRLEEDRMGKVLAHLDESSAGHTGKRARPRYGYRVKGLVVHMQQPGSAEAVPFQVPSRDISSTGLSFLHGGFVHTGTRCRIQLITMHGTWADLEATVVRCQYAEAGVHEIGVKFDREIDPSAYCSSAIRTRILLVDDDVLLQRLGKIYLEQLNADVSVVGNGKEALDAVKNKVFDLIVMDIEMPVMNGFEALAELRKNGYTGTVAAATGLSAPEDRMKCLAAGFDHYVPKPYKRDDLASLIESLREEPLFSSFESDPSMADVINSFVAELPVAARKIEEATSKGDLAALQQQMRTMKGQAGGHGFGPISEIAAQLECALLAQATLNDLLADLKKLMKLCSQVRPVSKPTLDAPPVAQAGKPAPAAPTKPTPDPAPHS